MGRRRLNRVTFLTAAFVYSLAAVFCLVLNDRLPFVADSTHSWCKLLFFLMNGDSRSEEEIQSHGFKKTGRICCLNQ